MLGVILMLTVGTLWVTGRCFIRSGRRVVFEMYAERDRYLGGRLLQVTGNLCQFPAIPRDMFGSVVKSVAVYDPSVKIQMPVALAHRTNDPNIYVQGRAA